MRHLLLFPALALAATACQTSAAPHPPATASAGPSASAVPLAPPAVAPLARGPLPIGKKNVNVHGWSLDVELREAKTGWVLGEPVFLDFVVKNRTSRRLFVMQGGDTINPFGRHDKYEITTVDAGGGARRDPLADQEGRSGGNSMQGLFPVPRSGEWTDALLLQDYSQIDAPGRYVVTFRHDLRMTDDDRSSPLLPFVEPVELSIAIDILPPDPVALGGVIDAYGKALRLGDEAHELEPRTRQALQALTRIEDPRVIPWLSSAATTGTYSQKFTALGPLAAFDDERAIRTMIQALGDADENIQSRAAYSLSRSKSERAFTALWGARKGHSEAVRLTVVHALGARKDPTATARLVEMTSDPSPTVSSEAKRYLGERGRKP